MRFKKARDVLEHVQRFHEGVSARCQATCGTSDQGRLDILLNYIAERERNLARSVNDFIEQTADPVLDTWFQYSTDDAELNELVADGFKPGMAPEDVTAASMAIADRLIKMYADMVEAADTDDLRRMFQNLLDHEQKEKEKLARNLQMFDDL